MNAPKPTALKLATGNPGKRPLPKGEPKPAQGIGEPPPWLDEEAKRQWFAVAADLEAIGMLCRVDGNQFASYCAAVAVMQVAYQTVRSEGITIDNGSKKNPAVNVLFDAMKTVKSFAAEFGLTPSARVRLAGLDIEPPEDDMEALLGK